MRIRTSAWVLAIVFLSSASAEGQVCSSETVMSALACRPALAVEIVGRGRHWAPDVFLERTPVFVALVSQGECEFTASAVLACLQSHPNARVRANVRFARRYARLTAADPIRAASLFARYRSRGLDILQRRERARLRARSTP